MSMDVNNPDVQIVKDYALRQCFVRLHLDLEIPFESSEDMAKLMNGERWEEVEELLTSLHGPKVPSFFRLFTAQFRSGQSKFTCVERNDDSFPA